MTRNKTEDVIFHQTLSLRFPDGTIFKKTKLAGPIRGKSVHVVYASEHTIDILASPVSQRLGVATAQMLMMLLTFTNNSTSDFIVLVDALNSKYLSMFFLFSTSV